MVNWMLEQSCVLESCKIFKRCFESHKGNIFEEMFSGNVFLDISIGKSHKENVLHAKILSD